MIINVSNTLKWAFNYSIAYISGSIINNTNVPSTTGAGDVLFKEANNTPLVFFNGTSGDILAKGIAVYNGSIAKCYQNVSGCSGDYNGTYDYFCNISSGKCDYFTFTSGVNCSTQCNGQYPGIGCSAGKCIFNSTPCDSSCYSSCYTQTCYQGNCVAGVNCPHGCSGGTCRTGCHIGCGDQCTANSDCDFTGSQIYTCRFGQHCCGGYCDTVTCSCKCTSCVDLRMACGVY